MNKATNPSRKKSKKLIKRLITTLVILLIMGGVGLYVYDSLKQAGVTTYDSYTVSKGSISNALAFSGTMQLVNSQTCTAAGNTTVRAVYV